jgi:long-chain acyl-CoA synthetase
VRRRRYTPVTEVSIGKVLRTKQVRIVDEATLVEAPAGEAGELVVSSDHMVAAYRNRDVETRGPFFQFDGGWWYRTGDVVRKDDKGFFYFVVRTADTIRHKGYRVSALEIEAALQEHRAVLAACAVGVPDAKAGERIKCLVALKTDLKRGYEL